jgi:hypothetical protein
LKVFEKAIQYRPWAVLASAVGLLCALHLLTLRIDPPVFQDEAQIVDYGRTILGPGSEWGMSWNVRESRPVLPFSYISAALQEVAFRVGGGSILGPRVSAMLGAALATLCCFGWLRARRTPTLLAVTLALLFFLDPVFSDVYRQGRVDGLAIASCLGACWLLRSAGRSIEQGRSARLALFFAGVLAALAPFLWLTAVALFPLMMLELSYGLRPLRFGRPWLRGLWKVVALQRFSVFGGFVAVGVLILPMLTEWDGFWSGLQSTLEVQQRASVVQNSIVDLFLVHDPALALLLIAALALHRDYGLIAALAAAVIMILQTMIYLPRVLYLEPYLVAIIASAGTRVAAASAPQRQRLLTGLLVIALAFNACWVLLVRPLAAWQQWPANDPDRIARQLEQVIGPGDRQVLLEVWEAYYAARQMGWRVYRAGSPVSVDEYLKLTQSMEFVITPKRPSYSNLSIERLTTAGFELQAVIEFNPPADEQGVRERLPHNSPRTVYGDMLVYRNSRGGPAGR